MKESRQMRASKYCPERGHDTACLCDVIITNPVEVNVELFVGGMFMEIVRAAHGDTLDLLDVCSEMARAKDLMYPTNAMDLTLAETRAIVKDYLPGGSMVDVDVDLGFTLDEAVTALVNGKTSYLDEWRMADWVAAELAIRSLNGCSHAYKCRFLAHEMDITPRQADTVLGYYGVTA